MGKVAFEPLGRSRIPDFGLGGRIGVEVRRLNENYFSESKTEGLEQVERPVWKALNKAVKRFEATHVQRSFWVMIEFERPIATKGKQLRQEMERSLTAFLESIPEEATPPHEIRVQEGLRFFLYPSSNTVGNPFRVMGISDADSGGMVVSLYSDNIRHCITEKSLKLSRAESKFEEWWLVLVDNLSLGLPIHEMQRVGQSITCLERFDRVILLGYHGNEVLLDLNRDPQR